MKAIIEIKLQRSRSDRQVLLNDLNEQFPETFIWRPVLKCGESSICIIAVYSNHYAANQLQALCNHTGCIRKAILDSDFADDLSMVIYHIYPVNEVQKRLDALALELGFIYSGIYVITAEDIDCYPDKPIRVEYDKRSQVYETLGSCPCNYSIQEAVTLAQACFNKWDQLKRDFYEAEVALSEVVTLITGGNDGT